jgi:hypothetical protein
MCIDRSGKTVFESEYAIGKFRSGVARIQRTMPPRPNDPLRLPRLMTSLVNREGKIILQPVEGIVLDFADDRAVLGIGAPDDAMSAIIDKSGTYVVRPTKRVLIGNYDGGMTGFTDGLVGYTDVSLGLSGYMDVQGKQVLPAQNLRGDAAPYVYPFSEGLACYRKGASELEISQFMQPKDWLRYGYINKDGTFAIPPTYTDAKSFSEGCAAVQRTGEKWGYIDKTGKSVIAPKYDDAGKFSFGVACVRINNLWGIIDKRGEFIVEPKFEFIGRFSDGVANFRWP